MNLPARLKQEINGNLMRYQCKKLLTTAFAIWALFVVPIIAKNVVEDRSAEPLPDSLAEVIDSLQTQEPPDLQQTPPGEVMVTSYYGRSFHGRRTASGEKYDNNELTCAHKSLPFQTQLKITNPKNGKSVVVRVNDRGPFRRGRQLDISYSAARELDMLAAGVLKLYVEILPSEQIAKEPAAGSEASNRS